jgi:hypothetical protein
MKSYHLFKKLFSLVRVNVQSDEDFFTRVTNIPLVNSTLEQFQRAYETTKANSNIVKYSAETVESSVKTLCTPVIKGLEPSLAQLDSFACRQLDKVKTRWK